MTSLFPSTCPSSLALDPTIDRFDGDVFGLIEESSDHCHSILDRERVLLIRRFTHDALDFLTHDHEFTPQRRFAPTERAPLQSVPLRDEALDLGCIGKEERWLTLQLLDHYQRPGDIRQQCREVIRDLRKLE